MNLLPSLDDVFSFKANIILFPKSVMSQNAEKQIFQISSFTLTLCQHIKKKKRKSRLGPFLCVQ